MAQCAAACATCYVVLSAAGGIFYVILGILCATKSTSIEVSPSKRLAGKDSSYIAAAIYGVIFVLCLLYLVIWSFLWPRPKHDTPNKMTSSASVSAKRKSFSTTPIETPVSTPPPSRPHERPSSPGQNNPAPPSVTDV